MSTLTLPTVRQSYAARFDQCPLSARFDQEAPDYSTHPQARGTVFHEFMRRLIRECIDTGEPVAPGGFARDLMGQVIRESGLPIPAVEHDELLRLAIQFVKDRGFDIQHIVDLEETYAVEIGGVRVTGKPDVVAIDNGTATITDYKTGWAVDPEGEVQGSFQLRLYARLIAEHYPQVHTFRLLLDYPRWSSIEPREATLTREDMPDIDAYMESLLARILSARESGEYPASPGPWCSTCAAPDRCPIAFEDRRDGAVTSDELARSYAEQLTVLDALRKQRMKALRPWCAEHGPIVHDGVEFGWAPKAASEECADKEALRQAMEKANLRWDQFFRPRKASAEFKARKAKDAEVPA